MYRIFTPDIDEIKLDLPSSKSISHRMAILAALNSGQTEIQQFLASQDTLITLDGLKVLGAQFKKRSDSQIIFSGQIGNSTGSHIYLGNSGSSARFLLPLAAYADNPVIYSGSDRLHERPVSDLLQVMHQLGIKSESTNNKLPVKIFPSEVKSGEIHFKNLISSQVVTAMMMAALWMPDGIRINLPEQVPSMPYIDLTAKLFERCNLNIEKSDDIIFVPGDKPHYNWNLTVEKDFSSSSYWVVLALINEIKVTLRNITLPSLQGDEKIFEIAEESGANIILYDDRLEISGMIKRSFEVNCLQIPDLVPALSVLALFAPDKCKLHNISNLQYKESNRIEAIQKNINKIGGKTEYKDGTLVIFPQKNYHGEVINTFSDHRIAMSFAVSGTRIKDIHIDDPGCVSKSYPQFWEHFSWWEKQNA